MELAEVPLVLMLVGLSAYAVLGGADFGAGLWYMTLGGEGRRHLRDHTYHAMGPVWEANHVWLIFVLVVAWTAYPTAFGSIASTLYVPLFVAALGIILRGTAYALRGSATGVVEERVLGLIFGASSVLTPLALGAAIGGIASGRVPVGNAAGDPVTVWLNATSIAIGTLAVATSAYMAAVWLTADAARMGRADIVAEFRRRATVTAAIAGGLALAGLAVLDSDAPELSDDLLSGAGLAAVVASAGAGFATLAFVRRGRFEAARYGAAAAVAAIVAGWALAQRPDILPGLTVEDAAASDGVLVALLISLVIGALILVPSLTLLFRMVLSGRFDERPQRRGSLEGLPEGPIPPPPPKVAAADSTPSSTVGLGSALAAGVGAVLMFVADGGIVLGVGLAMVLGGICAGGAILLGDVTRRETSELLDVELAVRDDDR